MKKTHKDLKFKDLLSKLRFDPVILIEEASHLFIDDLAREYSGKRIFVCDNYIKGIEEGIIEGNVLRFSNVISIDHHAPLEMFARKVSSTNLAIDWVNGNGIASEDDDVIITHTDYDSIMSGLIMRGIMPPEKIFGDMAIMADHTGEENEMVDLLQSMSSARDLEFSLRNLELWSSGKAIEEKSREMLEDLKDERRRAKEVVRNGCFKNIGKVFYAELPKKIESAFFPALIPEALVILTYSPHRKHEGFREVKTRLGNGAPEGLYLNKLGIYEIDPSWGGRWNAGSNRKGQGTKLSIEKYARFLNKKLEEHLEKQQKKKL